MILAPFNSAILFGVNIDTEFLGQTFTVSLVKLVAYLSGSYNNYYSKDKYPGCIQVHVILRFKTRNLHLIFNSCERKNGY